MLRLTGSKLPIDYQPQGQTFVTHRVGSIEKAATELGFCAATALDEGLLDLIRWRQEHKERTAELANAGKRPGA